jgi:CheY-like chemotaxis protein
LALHNPDNSDKIDRRPMNKKKLLMIVDDDKDDRFFFRRALRELGPGYECIEAENGLDAIAKLKEVSTFPDFIFLDLNMQLMNGKQTLKELKKDQRLQDIPVIIYSTSSYEEDIASAKRLGAAHYMTKQSDPFKLPEEIKKAMAAAIILIIN